MSVASRRKLKNQAAVSKRREMELHSAKLDRALRAYEAFYQLPRGGASVMQLEHSSAGVAGWYQHAIFIEQVSKSQTAASGHLQKLLEVTGVKEKMEEHMQCRTVIPRCTSASTFGVLATSQVSLCEVELGDSQVNVNEDWCDVEFEVALDSGSQDHVCDESDTPGYVLDPSEGSQRGACFVVGNGGRLPNQGQKLLNLESEVGEGAVPLQSCFQIARVTRPLMSVGKICDGGMKVEFTEKTATIKSPDGKTVCVFHRKPGGLYICKMRLKQPFPRQG